MNLNIHILENQSLNVFYTLVILSGSGAINIPGGGSLNILEISLIKKNKKIYMFLFEIKITVLSVLNKLHLGIVYPNQHNAMDPMDFSLL
jgi:hypothetical protein